MSATSVYAFMMILWARLLILYWMNLWVKFLILVISSARKEDYPGYGHWLTTFES